MVSTDEWYQTVGAIFGGSLFAALHRYGNVACLCQPREKWTRIFIQNFEDSRKCLLENGCNLRSAQISGNQNENPRITGAQRRDFERPIAETLVFRQDDPTALSHFLEPNTVLFISLEMIVMDFYGDSRFDERATCWLDAQ